VSLSPRIEGSWHREVTTPSRRHDDPVTRLNQVKPIVTATIDADASHRRERGAWSGGVLGRGGRVDVSRAH
jgi:hypothetical protein